MKGYKGFKSNLTCRGFRFEIGEVEIMKSKVLFAIPIDYEV